MKNTLLYSSLSLLLILCSCSKDIIEKQAEEHITIDLNAKEALNVALLKIIPLESNTESTIGQVRRATYAKDRIFVLDNFISMSLFSFDDKGKFIKKLLNGKGPGECNFPWDYYISDDLKSITLFDQRLFRFSEYDFDLNFKKATTKQIKLQSYTKTQDNRWLVWAAGQMSPNINDIHLTYLYDENFDNVTNKLVSYPSELKGYGLKNPISREKNSEVLFSKQYDQNLYAVDGESYSIKYHLDFGQLNLQKEDYTKDTRAPFTLSKEGKRVTSIDNLINNESWLSFSFFYMGKREFIIHSKETKKNYYSNSLEDQSLLPQCTLAGIHEGNFVGVVEAQDFIEFINKEGNEQLKGKYNSITNNDNPIILTFNVKELQ